MIDGHRMSQIYNYLFDTFIYSMPQKLIWSSSELRPYRQITDPIADKVVAEIIENDRTQGINKLFSQLRENDDVSEIDFPKCVSDYFEETSELPSFMDQEQVKIGQKVGEEKFKFFLSISDLSIGASVKLSNTIFFPFFFTLKRFSILIPNLPFS